MVTAAKAAARAAAAEATTLLRPGRLVAILPMNQGSITIGYRPLDEALLRLQGAIILLPKKSAGNGIDILGCISVILNLTDSYYPIIIIYFEFSNSNGCLAWRAPLGDRRSGAPRMRTRVRFGIQRPTGSTFAGEWANLRLLFVFF